MAKSPLIWFGGKAVYAELIIKKFPVHKKYVEPFGGAANVIAQKPKISHEVYNDIDGNVVNFLMVVRSEPDRFQEQCESLPYSRELYERWKSEPLPIDEFDRAVRWFYLNRSAISNGNAKEVSQTGWRNSHNSSATAAVGYIGACKRFGSFAERMKGVLIEHDDFRNIIERYDGTDTLFYVDPPYVNREKYYAGNFTENDHRDLANLLNQAKGKVVLSYYSDSLVDELYSVWHRETFQAYKQAAGSEGGCTHSEELLLMNFDNGQMTLF